MVEDTNESQHTVDITGHVVLQNVSYEKDIVEIKFADTVDSDHYGGNFVKDVCVDEGALFYRKNSEGKISDIKPSPKFSCQMIDANSDIRCGKKDDARKYEHEIKPEAVVPADFAPDCDNEKQCSSGKEYDPEDWISTSYVACDPSDKKISLQELLRLESAEESRHVSTVDSGSSEKNKYPLCDETFGQDSINDFYEAEAVALKCCENSSGKSSKDNRRNCLSTISEDQDADAVLDLRQPNKVDRYNPCIDRRSLVVEDIEPECCTQEITDATSSEPICTVDETDSFSSVTSGSNGLNDVKTAESEVAAVNSSYSDIQSPEKSYDQSENLASKVIAGVEDETLVTTSSTPNTSERSDANEENQEKCSSSGVTDMHDISQIHEENGIGTDDAISKGSTLEGKGSAIDQTAPDSSKSTDRFGNGDPFEPYLFGPSIMSAPVSMSGHMAYAGNVSLRSDSSTTSTRSFAFPAAEGVDQQPGEDGEGRTSARQAALWLEERTYLL
ncbi:hypothetical protein ACP4OV_006348 [Aristida adscensionis]